MPGMACARTINATCHCTVDGVPEISVQVRAQTVAMATKHSNISFVCKKTLFGCVLLLILMPVTACARTINVTCHCTVNGVSKNSVQVRAQAVAMATKYSNISFVCQSNPCLDAYSS